MTEPTRQVQRGDVYFMPFGEGKPRPVVVVSRDNANMGDCVVVVPFTTQRIEERKRLSWCAFFKAGEGGATVDRIAKADEITRVRKTEFDWKRGRITRLSEEQVQRVVLAIRHLIRDSDLAPR